MQMASKLRALYPEYYYKIISVCKSQKIPLLISLYNKKADNTVAEYIAFNKSAHLAYSNIISGGSIEPFANEPSYLKLLKGIVEGILSNDILSIDRELVLNDFDCFSTALIQAANKAALISQKFLYGRDVDSNDWYCQLFGNEFKVPQKVIERCTEIAVIESVFDWAGLINKHARVGIPYYESLQPYPGQFFNLIIPEVTVHRISFFDIDESEKLILDHLSQPKPIATLLAEMQSYAEEEVVFHHLEAYNSLMLTLIKQLVIKKAIKPF